MDLSDYSVPSAVDKTIRSSGVSACLRIGWRGQGFGPLLCGCENHCASRLRTWRGHDEAALRRQICAHKVVVAKAFFGTSCGGFRREPLLLAAIESGTRWSQRLEFSWLRHHRVDTCLGFGADDRGRFAKRYESLRRRSARSICSELTMGKGDSARCDAAFSR